MSRQRPHSGGFVLLYVLGVLAMVMAMVLGASLAYRERLAGVSAAKKGVLSEHLLKGAMQVAVAKVSVDRGLVRVADQINAGVIRLPRGYQAWPLSPVPRLLEWDGSSYQITLADAGWYPDANLLKTDEWSRLFVALGVTDAQAQAAARRIEAKRQQLAQAGVSPGFRTFDQLFTGLGLSPAVLFGDRQTGTKGVIDVLSLGTGVRRTDPDHTPGIVYAAIYNATPSQLDQLQRLRLRGPVAPAQEADVFSVPVQPVKAASEVVQLKILVLPSADGQAQSMGLIGFFSLGPNLLTPLSESLFFRE